MVILGVDPGLAHTGWGIVEVRHRICRCRAYGCIDTSKDDELHVRLHTIYSQLIYIIERYSPDEFAVEELFFGQNTTSAIAVSHARGVVLAAGAAYDMSLGEYTPNQIKLALVGSGRADKGQVTYMVRRLLKLDHDPTPDHSADALAAAICHAHMTGCRR